MRQNLPVTQRAIAIPPDYTLSSITDPKGRIVEVNADFVAISGFTREQLIGKAHNIVRHPDVPEAVFDDLWRSLKAGRSWRAVVKNRASNGDHYWVDANVSPSWRDGELIGYVSVRKPVSDEALIAATEQAYRDIASGRLRIESGQIHDAASWRRRRLDPARRLGLRMAGRWLLALLPLVLLTAWLGGRFMLQQMQHWQHAAQVETIAGDWLRNAALVGALQRERGLSSGWLASNGAQFDDELRAQRLAVDRMCATADCAIGGMPLSPRIAALRAGVDGADVAPAVGTDASGSARAAYSALIEQILDDSVRRLTTIDDSGLLSKGLALQSLLWMQEHTGVERATVGAALAAGRPDDVLRHDLHALSRLRDASLRQIRAADDDEWVAQLVRLQADNTASTAAFRAQAIDGDAMAQASLSFAAYSSWIEQLAASFEQQAAAWRQHSGQRRDAAALGLAFGACALLLALGIAAAVLTRMLVRQRRAIARLGEVMRRVAEDGDFHVRAAVDDDGDELSELARLTDHSLNQVERSLAAVNDVMAAVADGRMDRRIVDQLPGDLGRLRHNANRAVDSVDVTMQELDALMIGLAHGDLDVRLGARVSGELRARVNTTMDGLQRTLGEAAVAMSALAAGDFSRRVGGIDGGEFGRLRDAINLACERLDGAFGALSGSLAALADGALDRPMRGHFDGRLGLLQRDFNGALQRLQTLIGEVQGTVANVMAGCEELASGSDDLNQRTQQQSASLEETAASMEQMAATVRGTDEQARHARQRAVEAEQQGSDGSAVVQRATVAMARIGTASARITEIVGMIDGIAFQTNLLALNAAVEAARAGEQGRGFAVVASEVRALSQRSAEAARDIRSLISETTGAVAEGTALVGQSAASLTGLGESMTTIRGMLTAISTAASEQASGIALVNHTVSDLDGITQQNAALVEESTATAQMMLQQIDHLRALVAQFRIGTEPASDAEFQRIGHALAEAIAGNADAVPG